MNGGARAGFEQRFGRGTGSFGDDLARQHPRDFVDTLLGQKRRDMGGGQAVLKRFRHPEMMAAKGRDLRRMRDHQHLRRFCDPGKPAPDSIGSGAADAAVDLIENHRQPRLPLT